MVYSGRLNKSPIFLSIMPARKPSRLISPLFARYLTSDEKKSLRAVPADNPASEINLLRVLSAHLMKFQQSAPKDMDSRRQALRTCLVLSEQLSKLVRAHNKEYDPRAEFHEAILQAIEELRQEMGWDI
jgi:hypothetical protein